MFELEYDMSPLVSYIRRWELNEFWLTVSLYVINKLYWVLKVLGKCECHVWGAALCLIQKGSIIVRVGFLGLFFFPGMFICCASPFYCKGKLGKLEGNQVLCSGCSICSKRAIWRRTSLLGETLWGVLIHSFNCASGRDLSSWPSHWRQVNV